MVESGVVALGVETVRVALLEGANHVRLQQLHPVQLVPERHPANTDTHITHSAKLEAVQRHCRCDVLPP